MSLVTASETDLEQTESRFVNCVEMWCIGSTFGSLFHKSKFIWNFSTVEGDSPVDYVDLKILCLFLSRIRWISGLNVGGINF